MGSHKNIFQGRPPLPCVLQTKCPALELTMAKSNREQEKFGLVEHFHGERCRVRQIADVRLHIAVGLRPLRVDRGAIDRRGLCFRPGGCLFALSCPPGSRAERNDRCGQLGVRSGERRGPRADCVKIRPLSGQIRLHARTDVATILPGVVD